MSPGIVLVLVVLASVQCDPELDIIIYSMSPGIILVLVVLASECDPQLDIIPCPQVKF